MSAHPCRCSPAAATFRGAFCSDKAYEERMSEPAGSNVHCVKPTDMVLSETMEEEAADVKEGSSHRSGLMEQPIV
eukprot:1158568-Pelagomonas_calceolata.AAC.3